MPHPSDAYLFFLRWQQQLDTFGQQKVKWRAVDFQWDSEKEKYLRQSLTWDEIVKKHINSSRSQPLNILSILGQFPDTFEKGLEDYRQSGHVRRWWLRLTDDMDKKEKLWLYFQNRQLFLRDSQVYLTPEQQAMLETEANNALDVANSIQPSPQSSQENTSTNETWSLFGKVKKKRTQTPDEQIQEARNQALKNMSVWSKKTYLIDQQALEKLYQNPKNSRDFCISKEQEWAKKREETYLKRVSLWLKRFFKKWTPKQRSTFTTTCQQKFTELEAQLQTNLEEKLAIKPLIRHGDVIRQKFYKKLSIIKPDESSQGTQSNIPVHPNLQTEVALVPAPVIHESHSPRNPQPVAEARFINLEQVLEEFVAKTKSTLEELKTTDLTEIPKKIDAYYEIAKNQVNLLSSEVESLLATWTTHLDANEAKQKQLDDILVALNSSYRKAALVLHINNHHAKYSNHPTIVEHLNTKFSEFKNFHEGTLQQLQQYIDNPQLLMEEREKQQASQKVQDEYERFEKWAQEMKQEQKERRKEQKEIRERINDMNGEVERTNRRMEAIGKESKEELKEMKEQLKELNKQFSALKIQSSWRRHQAEKLALTLINNKDSILAQSIHKRREARAKETKGAFETKLEIKNTK